MIPFVVDTNVILVANGAHDDISPECVMSCVQRLRQLMDSGILVMDDEYRILLEYQKKTSPRKGKGVGDLFVQWALINASRTDRVHQVKLTEDEDTIFSEFPDPDLERIFDAPDRKFVAVSAAHPEKPAVIQASDCKWLDWWPRLAEFGLKIEFLCGADICRFYSNKFPERTIPPLP